VSAFHGSAAGRWSTTSTRASEALISVALGDGCCAQTLTGQGSICDRAPRPDEAVLRDELVESVRLRLASNADAVVELLRSPDVHVLRECLTLLTPWPSALSL